MEMRWGDAARDKYITPEISKFTTASIRDMSDTDPQQDHWLMNFILNTMTRVDMPPKNRQQCYNLLRKSHLAFAEYDRARERTLTFLDEPRRNLVYLEAIVSWESFLSYAWQAHLSFKRDGWFVKGDGSILQLLNTLYNKSKHADDAIERVEFLDDGPLCVWLTNNGLRSVDASLTFDEMAEVLSSLSRYASAVQDPLTAAEKLKLIPISE
jgi:hypothetical protein